MPRILVVEDDPDLLFLYENAFVSQGFEMTPAPDARAAIFQLQNTIFDAVILDLNLPDAHGSVIIDHVIINETMPPQHIVIVTANDQWSERLRKQGVEHILIKPIPITSIVETIRAITF